MPAQSSLAGDGSMSIRTIIVAKDHDLGLLLKNIARERGHEIVCLDHPSICPVYSDEESRCSKPLPCCDILIVDYETPWMTSLDLLEEQIQKGCHLPPRNKAFLSASEDPRQLDRARELGCYPLPKPFKLKLLSSWLDECEKRVVPGRQLVSLQAT